MKPLWHFILFLLFFLTLGSLLSYPVYQFILLFYDIPFDKVAHRLPMLLALLSFYWFLKQQQLTNRQALGYDLALSKFLSQVAIGIGIGIFMLGTVAISLFILGIRQVDPDFDHTLVNLIKLGLYGLFTGLIVALIEETFFRGALYSGIRRQASIVFAILATAVLYAGIHFLRSRLEIQANHVQWFSGLLILQDSVTPQNNQLDSFLALFMAGVFLAMVRQHRQNIALCVGIHAGWVMSIKISKKLTDSADSDLGFLVGQYDGITGYLTFIWLSILTLLYYFIYYPKKQSS